ncbi:MAG: hypothetical protein M3463_00765 [Verrucomicrobiota bacterium]|nr:hypothetical protein [Verrucomicrobiota bacterium]
MIDLIGNATVQAKKTICSAESQLQERATQPFQSTGLKWMMSETHDRFFPKPNRPHHRQRLGLCLAGSIDEVDLATPLPGECLLVEITKRDWTAHPRQPLIGDLPKTRMLEGCNLDLVPEVTEIVQAKEMMVRLVASPHFVPDGLEWVVIKNQ